MEGEQSNDRENVSSQTNGDFSKTSEPGEDSSRGGNDSENQQSEHADDTGSSHASGSADDGGKQPGNPGNGGKVILRDPKTGEPLRDQSPGQPSSWVGRGEGTDFDEESAGERFGETSEERLAKDLEE